MVILNIHGYQGSPENTNFKILHESKLTSSQDVEIISPSFDYDRATAEGIFAALVDFIIDYDIDLIVATSLGAFFGKCLSSEYKIPIIATNPCLRPDISLIPFASEWVGNNFDFIKRTLQIIKDEGYSNDVFIVGDSDDVVDPRITFSEAHDATIIHVKGGHSLEAENYRDVLLKEVSKIEAFD